MPFPTLKKKKKTLLQFDLVSTLLARRQISFLEILLWIRDEVRFGKVE